MRLLLVAAATTVAAMAVHAISTALIPRLARAACRWEFAGAGFWGTVVVLQMVLLIALVSHLCQVALWAGVFLACREFDSYQTAFYHSAVTYATLGYGDIVMSAEWRLLGPVEAINGALMIGLSTAVMFAVMSRLIERHWTAEGERPGPQERKAPR